MIVSLEQSVAVIVSVSNRSGTEAVAKHDC